MASVCDYCLNAAYDVDPEMGGEMQVSVAMQMGAELPDHLCDATEEPDLNIQCMCSCRVDRPRRDEVEEVIITRPNGAQLSESEAREFMRKVQAGVFHFSPQNGRWK